MCRDRKLYCWIITFYSVYIPELTLNLSCFEVNIYPVVLVSVSLYLILWKTRAKSLLRKSCYWYLRHFSLLYHIHKNKRKFLCITVGVYFVSRTREEEEEKRDDIKWYPRINTDTLQFSLVQSTVKKGRILY